jgi:AGZA family xanthine/uracil permease-like MFS transporter
MIKKWFAAGDVNGFFGLMFDNVTVLSFLAGILIFVFKYPADIVYQKMLPGTALAVLFGNLCYTWMAIKLRQRTGNTEVTAMPLGLDTPSTIGLALTVLGPCFVALKQRGMAEGDAAILTWQVGMATMIMIGTLKLILSFFGGWVQKIVPQAGLLGSLAGIGLALIGFLPLQDIFTLPVIGMISLGLILYNLVAQRPLPGNAPGVLIAVAVGTVLYYALGHWNIWGVEMANPKMDTFHFAMPRPTLGFVHGFAEALKYLPVAIPFGILTVVGGVNVNESARVAGDDYKTRDILLVEACATLLAGVFGGVAQSTPYIGQPAYKAMGSRIGYTLITGIFIGLGGVFGYVGYIVDLIPRAVLAPILIFVALDIMCQAFLASPRKHAPAVAFSYFPTVARLLQIKLGLLLPAATFAVLLAKVEKGIPELQIVVALGNGFILTGMLWGALIACLIDGTLRRAVIYSGVLAAFTFFGVIHSAMPDGNMYLPWQLSNPTRMVPYQFTAAYLALGAMILFLSFTKGSRQVLAVHS